MRYIVIAVAFGVVLAACQSRMRYTPRAQDQPPGITRTAAPRDGPASRDEFFWNEHGYYNRISNYVVRYSNETEHLFVNDNWVVDDYEATCDTFSGEGKCFYERKKGKAYYGVTLVDRDEDGTPEIERDYFFDLKLRNKRHNGVIWVSSSELPRAHTETLLDVFLDNYVDSLSGTELQLAGDPFGYAQIKQRKFATRVGDRGPAKLGPHDAVIATVTIADLDQLKLDETHEYAKLRVLVARVPSKSRRRVTKVVETMQGPVERSLVVDTSGKSLLVVGYFNTPAYFAEDLPDFEAFRDLLLFKTDEAGGAQELPSPAEPFGEEGPEPPPAKPTDHI